MEKGHPLRAWWKPTPISRHPLFSRWRRMMDRCYNEKSHNFKYYGQLGVYVCQEWHEFQAFAKDIGEIPNGLTIDRMDPRGPYAPWNVRLADAVTQANNKRNYSGGSIERRGSAWRARIRSQKVDLSYHFKTEDEAEQWLELAAPAIAFGNTPPHP